MRKNRVIPALITAFLFASVTAFAASDLDKKIAGSWKIRGGWLKNYGNELLFNRNHLVWGIKQRKNVARWKTLGGAVPVIEIKSLNNSKNVKYKIVQKGNHLFMYPRYGNDYHLMKNERVSGSINSGSGNSSSGGKVSGNIKRTGPFTNFTGYWIPLHKNGKNARKVPFYKGRKHGTGFWYYESGRIHYQTGWQHGKPHGIETEYWDKPGRIKKCKISYKNGKKNGWENKYNAQGLPVKSIMWKNNRKVSERNY